MNTVGRNNGPYIRGDTKSRGDKNWLQSCVGVHGGQRGRELTGIAGVSVVRKVCVSVSEEHELNTIHPPLQAGDILRPDRKDAGGGGY